MVKLFQYFRMYLKVTRKKCYSLIFLYTIKKYYMGHDKELEEKTDIPLHVK